MPVALIFVLDLDGTLAETAGDLIGALNFILVGRSCPCRSPPRARCLAPAGGR